MDQNPWHMHSVIPLETVVRYGVPSVTSRTKGISAVVGFWVPFFGLFFRKKLGVGWAICGGDHVVITSALASATSSLRTVHT